MEANGDWRSAAFRPVCVANQGARTRAFVPSRKILTTGTRSTRKSFFQAFVDVFALIVRADITSAAITVSLALDEDLGALSEWVSSVTR